MADIQLVPVAALVVIAALMAWSLWFPMAAGQLSMGPPASMAAGAYVAGYIAIHYDQQLALSLVTGAVAGIVIGVPISMLALRTREFAFAIASLMVVQISQVVDSNLAVIGGSLGMYGIPVSGAALAGGVISCVLVALFTWSVFQGRLGRVLDVMAYDEVLAATLGVAVGPTKVFVVLVASAVAGLDGALMARYVGFVAPDQFGLALITQMFAFVIVGGTGSIWGPFVGAAVLTIALQIFAFAGATRNVLYGAILIAFVLVAPEGIARRSSRLRSRRTRSLVLRTGASAGMARSNERSG